MDPKLLPGSGSGTQKIQSWIRNKSFRIHNTAYRYMWIRICGNKDPESGINKSDEIRTMLNRVYMENIFSFSVTFCIINCDKINLTFE